MKAPVTTATRPRRPRACGLPGLRGPFAGESAVTEEPDLDQLAEWIRLTTQILRNSGSVNAAVTPSYLQRKYRIGFNHACRLLEALQARGDLERVPGQALVWKLRQKPAQPQGEAFTLSAREREVLLGLLEWASVGPAVDEGGDGSTEICQQLHRRLARSR